MGFNKLVLSIGFLALSCNAFSDPSPDLVSKMKSIGEIKSVVETQTKGIFAWTFAKNGKTLVLFNTPDNKFFIKGTIYDLSNKQIVSDQYSIDSLKYASPEFKAHYLGTQSPPSTTSQEENQNSLSQNSEIPKEGFINLKWNNKQIPDALSLIDNLHGAKEGKALPQDTLYIFYDPTCTWCHSAYSALRPYIANNRATVKWIPTLARGTNPQSVALAAAALRSTDNFRSSFENPMVVSGTQATNEEMKVLKENTAFLFAFSKKVLPENPVSIPFGVYLNKQNGKVTPQQGGLNEKVILDMLYGEF